MHFVPRSCLSPSPRFLFVPRFLRMPSRRRDNGLGIQERVWKFKGGLEIKSLEIKKKDGMNGILFMPGGQ